MRKKKLYLNTFSSLLNQIIALLCGFILPRCILSAYGSEVNGVVSSITQFLGFVSLLDLGVGAVVQSAYYKPLAENDDRLISLLFNSSKNFFKIVAGILIAYICVLCIVFPHFVHTNYSSIYIITLIIIISISSFAQYYFAVPHQLLLNADQHYYVQSNMQIITLVLNTVISVIFIKLGCSIHVVKLASSVIFIIRPFVLSRYVRANYNIDYKLKDKSFRIDQKWNGLAQHCATVVMNNTDVMILSVFSTMANVSIYSIYYLVVNGLKLLINALSNGFSSLFGDIYANKERDLLNETFHLFEWIIHNIVIYVFSISGLLIVSFVMNYTRGIVDAQYYQPLFADFMCISQGIYCIRIPYNTMICAAGHYRQTQKSAIVEMTLNIVISVVLVYKFGLIGVTLGTMVAMTYRTAYFVNYLHRNILFINLSRIIKQLVVDSIQIALIIIFNIVVCRGIDSDSGFSQWLVHAIIISLFSIIVLILTNIIFYKENVVKVIGRIKR